MACSREQAALRARRTVELVFDGLLSTRAVARFVDTYTAANNRQGLKAHPVAHRELLMSLRREALLAICARMNADLPRRLTGRDVKQLKPAAAQAADAFRAEFFVQLAKELKWTEQDLEDFWSDLDLYAQIGARQSGARKLSKSSPAAGPFVDRCAVLLDPAFFDQARRASAKFLVELELLAESSLKQAFRPQRRKDELF